MGLAVLGHIADQMTGLSAYPFSFLVSEDFGNGLRLAMLCLMPQKLLEKESRYLKIVTVGASLMSLALIVTGIIHIEQLDRAFP